MSDPPDITQADRAQAATGPTLAQIAGRVLNRPLLLHPDKADLILHVNVHSKVTPGDHLKLTLPGGGKAHRRSAPK